MYTQRGPVDLVEHVLRYLSELFHAESLTMFWSFSDTSSEVQVDDTLHVMVAMMHELRLARSYTECVRCCPSPDGCYHARVHCDETEEREMQAFNIELNFTLISIDDDLPLVRKVHSASWEREQTSLTDHD